MEVEWSKVREGDMSSPELGGEDCYAENLDRMHQEFHICREAAGWMQDDEADQQVGFVVWEIMGTGLGKT